MNPQELADRLALLQIEFNTLDSSLVAAILNDTGSLTHARETLTILSLETIVDDNLSCPEWGDSTSDETDPTTYSLSSWRIDDEEEDPGDHAVFLGKMFPKLTAFSIKTALDKCQGDLSRATDELLSRVFLAEDSEENVVKGVDGFDVGLGAGTGKKKGRRNRAKRKTTIENLPPDRARTASLPNDSPSRWEEMASEISYIASSLNLPEKSVTSVYHHHNGALAPTIAALLDTNAPSTINLNPAHLTQLKELSTEFGTNVKLKHLETLLHLCKDNTHAIFNLAGMLRRNTSKPTIKIATTLPTPSPTRPTPRTDWITVGGTSPSSPISPPTSPRTYSCPLQSLSAQTSARNEAYSKAAASYRKARSDPLMGGVAAFYSSRGRNYDADVRRLRDEAAEEHINSNSNLNTLDLHGATVSQGVRFARERTTDWWVRQMREQELAGGVKRAVEPFNIVTGMGRHSKDGVPQLLPAVTKMLIREKWRVVCEEGKVVVVGVVGRGRRSI